MNNIRTIRAASCVASLQQFDPAATIIRMPELEGITGLARPTVYKRLKDVCVWASRLAQLNQSPPMRQQLRNLTCPLRRQAREDVLQIGVRVMPVESS